MNKDTTQDIVEMLNDLENYYNSSEFFNSYTIAEAEIKLEKLYTFRKKMELLIFNGEDNGTE